MRFGATVIALGAALVVAVAPGCGDSSSPSEPPDPAQMVDGGSWYSRGQRWPHDGEPFESQNFVVYSDGSSLEARQRLASIAEQVLVEVVDELGVDPATMFRFPANQDKIDLYANRYNVLEGGGGRAYYAGVIIASFDHEAGQDDTDERSVRLTLHHELVHVVEALLKGRFVGDVPAGDLRRMPVWFSEGTAEALSGGTTTGAPRTLDRVDHLIAEYGRINPISWRVDLPLSESVLRSYSNYYYPMAQLAVEYLLAADGLGKSPEDLAAVMVDIGNDASFASAFETHIGISEAEYETQFFALMDAYLPQSEPPLEAIGMGLLSLLAASLMTSSLVWGFRHWPASAMTPGQIDDAAWSRRARRGFLVEISTIGSIAVGFVGVLLFNLALQDLSRDAPRAAGYLITTAYLVISVGILMWAIRRWARRTRLAYLIPLLVIVATAAVVLTVELIF